MLDSVFYVTQDGILTGFNIKGHSGYADSGSDIVCAAVSSAAYMTANTVTEILHANAEVGADDGNIYLRIFQKDALRCQDILQGFKLQMLQLEEQYSKYISVNYTEV